MNQGKRRLKEISNQLNISEFITPSGKTPTGNCSRSSSLKRKKDSPPCTVLNKTGKKCLFIIDKSEVEQSTTSINTTMKDPTAVPTTPTVPSSSSLQPGEVLMLQAVKDLLKPMDERISAVLNTQIEMKTTIGEAAMLKHENEKLKQKVTKMKEINSDLNRRLTNLENRIFESNVILTGVREGVWEMDEDRKEMIYEIISDIVLGRSFDDRIQTAKMMHIRST